MTVAIVGLGSIGRRHARIIHHQYPGMSLVSVRRQSGARCPEDRFFKRRHATVDEAVARGVDAAIICSPATLHATHTLSFLRAGIPVLVEKPLTATLSDAVNITADRHAHTVQAMNRSLVGYVLRHHESFAMVARSIAAGNLGSFRGAWIQARSHLPDWRPGQDYLNSVSARRELGGGVLRELSHEIDYAMALFGVFRSVVGVRNSRSALALDVDEQVQILAVNDAGAPVSIYLDFASTIPVRQLQALFENGEITWDLMQHSVTLRDRDGNITSQNFPMDRDAAFVRQFDHFLRCVAGECPPICPIEQGVEVVKVIAAVEKSIATATAVPIA